MVLHNLPELQFQRIQHSSDLFGLSSHMWRKYVHIGNTVIHIKWKYFKISQRSITHIKVYYFQYNLFPICHVIWAGKVWFKFECCAFKTQCFMQLWNQVLPGRSSRYSRLGRKWAFQESNSSWSHPSEWDTLCQWYLAVTKYLHLCWRTLLSPPSTAVTINRKAKLYLEMSAAMVLMLSAQFHWFLGMAGLLCIRFSSSSGIEGKAMTDKISKF